MTKHITDTAIADTNEECVFCWEWERASLWDAGAEQGIDGDDLENWVDYRISQQPAELFDKAFCEHYADTTACPYEWCDELATALHHDEVCEPERGLSHAENCGGPGCGGPDDCIL